MLKSKMLKVGDIVRYKNCRTEYEVVGQRKCIRYVDIKLTKLDPLKLNANSSLGRIFPALAIRLEIIKKAPRHPLTNIFQ